MAYNTSVAAELYKNTLSNYRSRIGSYQSRLKTDYNFGLSPSDANYHDFWEILLDYSILGEKNYNTEFDRIINVSQSIGNFVDEKYMNMLGMVQMLDSYMCNISDIFSRAIDTVWGCGLGGIYISRYGKDLPDGSKEILKKGVQYYTGIINTEINEIGSIISNMDLSNANDTSYLVSKRNEILNKIRLVEKAVKEVEVEIHDCIEIIVDADLALRKWILECFNMVANITLIFNLNTKNMRVANKILTIGDAFNPNTQMALSIAKHWKEKVVPDMSNLGECTMGAIKQGLSTIPEPGLLEKFQEMTWDLMLPKY